MASLFLLLLLAAVPCGALHVAIGDPSHAAVVAPAGPATLTLTSSAVGAGQASFLPAIDGHSKVYRLTSPSTLQQSGFCVGVFAGSADATGLRVCLGDGAACRSAENPALWACRMDDAATVALASLQILTLIVASSSRAVGTTATLTLALADVPKPPTPAAGYTSEAPSPMFTVAARVHLAAPPLAAVAVVVDGVCCGIAPESVVLVAGITDYTRVRPGVPSTFALRDCRAPATVTVHALHLAGTPLATSTHAVHPVVECARLGLAPDCYCVDAQGRRRAAPHRGADVTLDVDVEHAATGTGSVTVMAQPDIAMGTGCVLLGADTGVEIAGTTRPDGRCVASAPPGEYVLVAANHAAASVASVLDGGAYAVQVVEICSAQPPALVFTERPVPALTLTPPLKCHEPPAATPRFALYHEGTPVAVNGSVLWFPAPGHYRADVACGAPEKCTARAVVPPHDAVGEPVFCEDVRATVAQNRAPTTPDDHGAWATLRLEGAVKDADFAVQVRTDGVAGPWLTTGTEYSHPLRSGESYAFRFMRVQRGTDQPVARSVCYVSGGAIDAAPLVAAAVVPPLQIVAGRGGDLLFSRVRLTPATARIVSAVTDMGAGVDVLSDGDATNATVILVAGPLRAWLEPYVRGSLVIYAVLSSGAQITIRDVDDALARGLYPPRVTPSDPVVVATDAPAGVACGAAEARRTLTVAMDNPTWLPLVLSLRGAAGTHDRVDVEVGAEGLAEGFAAGVDPRGSAIVAAALPPVRLAYGAQQVVPDEVGAVMLPLSEDGSDTATVCAGRRLFRVSIPGGRDAAVRLRTDGDADVGSVAVTDGAVFAFTIGRREPVVLLAFYNPGGHGMGVLLRCTSRIASANFAVDAGWFMPVPQLSLTSQGAGMLAMTVLGGTSVAVEVFTSEGAPVILRVGRGSVAHAGQMWATGLVSGMYSAVATWSGQAYTCTRTQHFMVAGDGDAAALGAIVDDLGTTAGVQRLACPRDLFGEEHAWVQYYVLSLRPEPLAQLQRIGTTFQLRLWPADGSASAPVAVAVTGPSTKIRMAAAGAYAVQLSASNPHAGWTRTIQLPDVAFADPLFSVESFAMEVVTYPSCRGTRDGEVRITRPPGVDATIRILRCVPLVGGECVRGATVTSTEDFFHVSGLPFATDLAFAFEISGACRLDGAYAFLPPASTHPAITRLVYMPSCGAVHAVVALDGTMPIADAPNRHFTWSTTSPTSSSTETQSGSTFALDVARYAGSPYLINLTLTYGEGCVLTGGLELGAAAGGAQLQIPPQIAIEPYYAPRSRSLPVFCPGEADAVLTAVASPPFFRDEQIEWRRWTPGNRTWSLVPTKRRANPELAVAYNLGPGVYEVRYRVDMGGGRTCTATAGMHVPPKAGYEVLRHVEITRPACPGGTGAIAITGHGEIAAFRADMLTSADRRYLQADEHGASRLVGVPDGHTVLVRVPRPDSYVYATASPTCQRHLPLTLGRLAPLPVLPLIPADADSPVHFYVPPWHARARVDQTSSGLVLRGACEERRGNAGEDAQWRQEIDPVAQTLPCPDAVPQDVRVFDVYVPTGERFLRTTRPAVTGGRGDPALRAINASFAVHRAPARLATDVAATHPECNASPDVEVTGRLDDSADDDVHCERAAADSKVAACRCTASAFVCVVPRGAFVLTIPYTSALNGSCAIRVDLRVPLAAAAAFHPGAAVRNATHVCAGNSTIACVAAGQSDGTETVRIAGSVGKCAFDHTVSTAADASAADVTVQVVSPSCRGGEDGAVVWRLARGDARVVARDGVTVRFNVSRAPWGDVATHMHTGLRAGTHSIVVEDDAGRRRTLSAAVPETDPLSVVVQPAAHPPPGPWHGDVLVTGLPQAASGPIALRAYIHGGSEATVVSIGNSTAVLRVAGDDQFWQHVGDLTISPGTPLDVDVRCGDAPSPRRRGTVFLASARPLAISAQISAADAGAIVVVIDGGVPPFLVTSASGASNSTVRSEARRIVLSGGGDGALVSVMDSQGTVARAVAAARARAFDITGATLQSVSGCGAHTSGVIRVDIVGEAPGLLVGAWDADAGEAPITSCHDERLRFANPMTTSGPGAWRMAACAAGRYFAHDTGPAIRVDARVVPFAASFAAGTCGHGTLTVTGETHGTVWFSTTGAPQRVALALEGGVATIANLAVGLHRATLADDWLCPVDVEIAMPRTTCPVKHAPAAAAPRRAETPSSPPVLTTPEASSEQSQSREPERTHSASPSPEKPLYNGSDGMTGIALTLVMTSFGVVVAMLVMFYLGK